MGGKACPELMLFLLCNSVVWMEGKLKKKLYISTQKLPWDEARLYCQKNYIDMVTWDTTDLLSEQQWEKDLIEFWIGLHRDPDELLVWRWIDVKTGKGFTENYVSNGENWSRGQILGGHCGSYNSKIKKWQSSKCSLELHFICYGDNLVIVKENKTWEDALSHCREMTNKYLKFDLLSIRNSSDYSYVRDRIHRATTEEVWTGLRFLGGEWWWSDGETLENREMLLVCPDQWKHCGTLSKHNTSNWTSTDCSERRNFICYYREIETAH